MYICILQIIYSDINIQLKARASKTMFCWIFAKKKANNDDDDM